jgi:cytidylate kinase
MGAITISRQRCSQGDELALRVAHTLGWRCVCRDLINRSAVAAGAPQVALAELDELDLFGLRPAAKEWQAYQKEVEGFIRNLADEGNVVIVGRGGQIVLRGRPEVLHVRVVAPLEERIARLQQSQNISAEAARALLTKSDQTRAYYVRRSYNTNVNDPALYHLVLNTGFLGLDRATKLVIQAFQQ